MPNLASRVDRIERDVMPRDYLTVIISRFGGSPNEALPRWYSVGRVLVVNEGEEERGRNLLRSLGELPHA